MHAQVVTSDWDVESTVLARAITWHAKHRVLLHGHHTVVFH